MGKSSAQAASSTSTYSKSCIGVIFINRALSSVSGNESMTLQQLGMFEGSSGASFFNSSTGGNQFLEVEASVDEKCPVGTPSPPFFDNFIYITFTHVFILGISWFPYDTPQIALSFSCLFPYSFFHLPHFSPPPFDLVAPVPAPFILNYLFCFPFLW